MPLFSCTIKDTIVTNSKRALLPETGNAITGSSFQNGCPYFIRASRDSTLEDIDDMVPRGPVGAQDIFF